MCLIIFPAFLVVLFGFDHFPDIAARCRLLRAIPLFMFHPSPPYRRVFSSPPDPDHVVFHNNSVSLPLPFVLALDVPAAIISADDYVMTYSNLVIKVIRYRGFLLSNRCHLFRNRTFYVSRRTGIQGIPRVTKPPARFDGVYEDAIAICHDFMSNFYHVMIDIVSLLFLFPSPILSRSIVIVPDLPAWMSVLLNGTVNFLVMKTGHYVYAENAYSINPLDVVFPLAIERLRAFCVQRFGLGRIPANRYCLINRRGTRCIANMTEVLRAFKRGIPECKWEIEQFCKSIVKAAELFDSLRVFFAPHGAGTSNIVLMQQGTLLVDIESDRLGLYYLNMTRILGIRCVFSRLSTMIHGSTEQTAVPTKLLEGLVNATRVQLHMMDQLVPRNDYASTE
jgi:hypothetical protein